MKKWNPSKCSCTYSPVTSWNSEKHVYAVECINCGRRGAWSASEGMAIQDWDDMINQSQVGKGKHEKVEA
jgi:hypothetical protein